MLKLTGGTLKGHLIKTISGNNTRPSSAKVRESIFNILGDKITDKSWLDLFGGSGAVGMEALSRGAAKSVFVEKDYGAFNCLKKNIDLLKLQTKSILIKRDSISYLRDCDETFDFIFLDPPYISDYYNKTFSSLQDKPKLLNTNGYLIVEHSSKIFLPDIYLSKLKSYKYGDTTLSIFKNDGKE